MSLISKRSSFLLMLIAGIFITSCAIAPSQSTRSQGSSLESAGSSNQPAGSVEYPSISTPVAGLEQRPDDIAIIVGIEDYVFLPPVKGARQTAYDWEDFFRDSLGMRDIYTLLDDDANLEDITAYLEESRSEIGSSGRLWFVFVGHGAPGADGADGLLVGMDARQNLSSLTARSLSRSNLIETLTSGATDDVVVVLDTCFSGQSPEGAQLIEGAQPVLPVIEPEATDSSALVLSAARSDQLAGPLTGSERPSFSYLLLGALRGWAVDGGGDITAENAHRFTDRQLRHVSTRRQRPQLEGPHDRVLVRNASEPAPDLSDLLSGRALARASAQPTSRPASQEGRQRASESSPAATSDPTRSSERPAPQGTQMVDMGQGLTMELSAQWRVTRNEPGSDDSYSWTLQGYGGTVSIDLMRGKGSFFDANVDTMVAAFLDSGAQLLSSTDNYTIPPHTGHLRSFHYYNPYIEEEEGLVAFFVRNQRDLWFFVTRFSGDDGLDPFMEAFVHLLATTRFSP